MDKIFGLNNIQSRESASKKRKRVGRGNASGHGSYSGKGRKGEKARTGSGNGLKVFALRQLIMRTPKLRGFILMLVILLKNLKTETLLT